MSDNQLGEALGTFSPKLAITYQYAPRTYYWYGNHGRPGPRPNGTYCVIGTTYRFSPFRRSLDTPAISLVVVGLGERDVLSGSPRLGRSRPPDPRLNTPRDRIFGRLPK